MFLAEKGFCRIDGILQIVNIQIDGVGEDSVATILGHKERRNGENRAIHCPFFQAGEHGRRGAKLNGLDVFYSHAPLLEKELQDPVGRGTKTGDGNLLSFQLGLGLDVWPNHQPLQTGFEGRGRYHSVSAS